ncbi:MAG TPA: hypothetical protein VLD18_11890 [Verrucomicrobiae bacterium]|nr:hypothetical protein [Verrucomicrobiae bacterium]
MPPFPELSAVTRRCPESIVRGGAIEGQGLAIAGLVTGYLGIALALITIPLMLAIAIPNFVKARETAQRTVCINNLRQLDGAKEQWAIENNKLETDTPTAGALALYLNHRVLKCPAGGNHKLNTVGEAPSCSIPEHGLDK